MLEALWSVRFFANNTQFGGTGVVVIDNGRVLGGDASYLYVGDVKIENVATNTLRARVHIYKYQDVQGIVSVTGLTDYYGIFEGKVARDKIVLNGHVESRPEIKIRAELTRRAELP